MSDDSLDRIRQLDENDSPLDLSAAVGWLLDENEWLRVQVEEDLATKDCLRRNHKLQCMQRNDALAEVERLRATLAQPHMQWAAEQHSVGVDPAAEDVRLRPVYLAAKAWRAVADSDSPSYGHCDQELMRAIDAAIASDGELSLADAGFWGRACARLSIKNTALIAALRVARSELSIAASYADARDISIGLKTHARACADAQDNRCGAEVRGFGQMKEKTQRQKLNRIQQLRNARAIIAVACLHPWTRKATNGKKYAEAPNYKRIGDVLGLDNKAVELADEMWNQANGPDEGKETEEKALDRVVSYIAMEMDDL